MLRTPVLRRQSVYRITGEAKAKAEAKAETAKAKAKAEAKAEAAKAKAKAEAKWSSTGAFVGSRELGPS